MPWRLASLTNLGLARASRKAFCNTSDRSGGVPGGSAYRRRMLQLRIRKSASSCWSGVEGQVLEGCHSGRRFGPRPRPDGQERADGIVLDEVAVAVLDEVEREIHALQLFPFQRREDAGGALVAEDDLDGEPERALEFTHDGGGLAHPRGPDGEGLLPLFQVFEGAYRQVAPDPQDSRQRRQGRITEKHETLGVELGRGVPDQGLHDDAGGEVDDGEPVSRLFRVDPVGCDQAARPRHVLHDELGLARYVERQMPGQHSRERVESAARIDPDDDLDRLAFVERSGRVYR